MPQSSPSTVIAAETSRSTSPSSLHSSSSSDDRFGSSRNYIFSSIFKMNDWRLFQKQSTILLDSELSQNSILLTLVKFWVSIPNRHRNLAFPNRASKLKCLKWVICFSFFFLSDTMNISIWNMSSDFGESLAFVRIRARFWDRFSQESVDVHCRSVTCGLESSVQLLPVDPVPGDLHDVHEGMGIYICNMQYLFGSLVEVCVLMLASAVSMSAHGAVGQRYIILFCLSFNTKEMWTEK